MSVVSVVCFQLEVSGGRADPSSRGVLSTVVRRCAWYRNFKTAETYAQVGAQGHGGGEGEYFYKLTLRLPD